MFLGQYQHNIDSKGRLTIPARFRDLLAGGAYVTRGFDQNLMVLTSASFEAIIARVNKMNITDPNARELKRLLFSTADHAEPDKNGRILLPQFLREQADLNGEAMLVGVGDYFEIWSPAAWQAQLTRFEDSEETAQRFVGIELSAQGSEA